MIGRMTSKGGSGSNDGLKTSAAGMISSAIRIGAITIVPVLERGLTGTVTSGGSGNRTRGGSVRLSSVNANQTATVGGDSASSNSRTSDGKTTGVSNNVTWKSCSVIAVACRASHITITDTLPTRTIAETSTTT